MVYVIQVCCVYSEKLLMMDRGTVRKTCRVLFQKQIREIGPSVWCQVLIPWAVAAIRRGKFSQKHNYEHNG